MPQLNTELLCGIAAQHPGHCRLVNSRKLGAPVGSFVYDAFGRRVQTTINGTTTQYLYDWLNPVQELAVAVGGTTVPSANLLNGLRIDEYFQRTDPVNGSLTFLTDGLGSTIALTNTAGSTVTSYTYEPFGKTTANGTTAVNPNPYQFTGRENDGTGLYFYRARHYSPTFQRFVAQDPVKFASGLNLFVYADDAPLNETDPLRLYGTESCDYYLETCLANGGAYECYAAYGICEGFPGGSTDPTGMSNCIRQCLQETHRANQPLPNSCSAKSQIGVRQNIADHLSCFTGCVANPNNPYDPNGPDLP